MVIKGVSETTASGKRVDIENVSEKRKLELRILKLETMINDIYSYKDIANKKCNICKIIKKILRMQ